MKLPMPWIFLVASANMSVVFADNGLDAYRQGDYDKAALLLNGSSVKDPIVDYYMGRMRLYGYGQLKNNLLAIRHFKQAAVRGFLPAIGIMARYSLLEEKNPEQALIWFKKAAEQNDVESQMYCAAAYLFGVGVKQNSDLAKRYYIAAAKNGNSTAQLAVAQSFIETRHSANKTLGLIWLNKAVAQNNPDAQLMLGQLYAKGFLVDKDMIKARELVGLAVAQGLVPAINEMGELALQDKDYSQAKEWFTKAADLHFSPAEIGLSKLYIDKSSPFYDVHNGFLWMLKAAQSGNKEAQLALSAMYKNGQGVEADANLAAEWQQKATATVKNEPNLAEFNAASWLSHGKAIRFADTAYRLRGILSPWTNASALKENDYNASPQMEMATRDNLFKPQFAIVSPNQIAISEYYNALVTTLGGLSQEPLVFPNYPIESIDKSLEANRAKQLKAQAVLGDSNAQFTLAQLNQQGIGVKQNIDDAVKYYQQAAAQQDLRAEYNLGVLYLTGSNIQADYKKGFDLLVDAAFKGNPYAQYVLAGIYEQGYRDASGTMVIKPNKEQAMAMYSLAATNNDGKSQYRLAEILVREKSTSMTRVEKEQHSRLIKDLYQGAVRAGVQQAALPLAFFNAMDADKTKQAQALAVAKKAAEDGQINASLLLGLMYDYGIAVEANEKEAVRWYEKASSNPIGAFLLGTHLTQGTGISKNVEKGQDLLKKAANANFSYANLNLAIMQQQNGQDFLPELEKAWAQGNNKAGLLLADYYSSSRRDGDNEQHMKQARDIYQHIAEMGDKDGQLKLAYLFENGLGGPSDMVNAQKWYTLAAEQGDPIAQFLLGHLYQMGWLDKQPDYLEAKKWYSRAQDRYAPAAVALGFVCDTVDDDYTCALDGYERAASTGDAIGRFNAGLVYQEGKGLIVDNDKASQLYLLAAKQGHVKSMVQLAKLYFSTSKDKQDALPWYKKAAELGDREALYQLGLLSETGVATQLDYSAAVGFYQQSANKGNANAKLALARMYQYGLGVPKDIQKSFELYKELAASNNAYAQYQLSTFCYEGSIVGCSAQQGKHYLEEAQNNGNGQAQKALQWLAAQQQDKVSFIEPALFQQAATSTQQSAELMYFDALNTWNRGDASSSKRMLAQILAQFPDYTPAKRAYEQLVSANS